MAAYMTDRFTIVDGQVPRLSLAFTANDPRLMIESNSFCRRLLEGSIKKFPADSEAKWVIRSVAKNWAVGDRRSAKATR
jgi:hypothetical protein